MDIKPCPHCGGDALPDRRVVGEVWWWAVYCNECNARGEEFIAAGKLTDEDARAEAIEAWNKRAGDIVETIKPIECIHCGKKAASLVFSDNEPYEDSSLPYYQCNECDSTWYPE